MGTWTDDAGDTGIAKLSMDTPWSIDTSEGNGGPLVYKTGSYDDDLCSGLVTPELLLDTDSVLTFFSQYAIENGWDKGEVQISTNGGSSWNRVEVVTYPGSSTRTSDACNLPAGDYFTGVPGLSYASYTADLSTGDNQSIMIRWVLSSDGSVNSDGWWIDDISITNAYVPYCTTGSGCTNPDQPEITAISDVNACLSNGVQITYTEGSGASRHDLYDNTVLVVTDFESNDTYTPIDNTSHSYVIRAVVPKLSESVSV